MLNFNNEKGSTTIESFIIVPIVLILLTIFIVLLIASYEKTISVVSVHQKSMRQEVEEFKISNKTVIKEVQGVLTTRSEYMVMGKTFKSIYEYKGNNLDIKGLQNIIELLIHLVKKYDERLEEIGK